MKFSEQNTVENHIIEYLSGNKAGEFNYARNRKSGAGMVADAPRKINVSWNGKTALGYKYIPPAEFAKLREFENEFIIISRLLEAIKKINKIDNDEAQSVIREVKKIDTNQEFLNTMREGIDIKDLKTNRVKNYKIMDFKNPENNSFVITNQFYFEGNAENIRPDMLVFLNGLPICDIEAKSPVAGGAASFENAIDQIKRYERNARRLFLPNCFNIATDGLKAVYGATYSPKQYFFKWREEKQDEEKELELTLDALLSPNKLLDIIKNFILFEKENEKLVKKIARYQQMRAANKIVKRVKSGNVKRGLIWHTQGSGKSLTMFFTAWKLRFDQSLKNPKIFVLIDRIDLDDQIYDTFINCGGKNVIRVVSREDLRKKIKSPERGIFISTIQKFSELGDEAKNLDQNIIVLSDEAHRDNEGISAINLRSAMKNAFFFGFTGTPIDRTTLNTYRNFSEGGERYLDYYSIQQAIDDGA
ncbi:MAG: HsdR family type I site-specific deoxyribonuclease, partial [Patescibacteria group bacterium]